MVREDIFEGLKSGLARGKSLQETMQSFYNSGYEKKEIEEAAKVLLYNKTPAQVTPQIPSQPVAQPTYQPQTVSSTEPVKKQTPQMQDLAKTNQLVSYYDTSPPKPKKSTNIGLIILLVVILFILFGALIAVFLFKENIINLFQ